jgi:hypothetical protein
MLEEQNCSECQYIHICRKLPDEGQPAFCKAVSKKRRSETMPESILRNTNYKLNIIKENLQYIKENLKTGGLTPNGIENYTENLQLCADGLEFIILEIEEAMSTERV